MDILLQQRPWRGRAGDSLKWDRLQGGDGYIPTSLQTEKRNLCTAKTACGPALEEADAWNVTLTYDPRTLLLFTFGTYRGERTLQISAANCSAESMLPDRDLGSGGLSLILPGETHEAKSNFSLLFFYW